MTPLQFKKCFIFSGIFFFVLQVFSLFWTFKLSVWQLKSFSVFEGFIDFIMLLCYISVAYSAFYYPLRNLKIEANQRIPRFTLAIKKYIWAIVFVISGVVLTIYRASAIFSVLLAQSSLFWLFSLFYTLS